jgi:hypothetical protein
MRIRAKLAAAFLAAATILALFPGTASAHAERSVGPFDLEIGFRDEPAYVGVPNAAFLELSRDGNPVTDIGDALSVTLRFGDQTSDPLVFDPLEEPGQYQAPFVPSQAGAYTFTLSGTLDGVKFDLSLTSGPKTFDEVQDLSGATFPQVQAPTNADLASRIQEESDRTSSAIADATAAATDAQAAADSAKDAADSAKAFGIIGIVVGAIGLIVGAFALSAARKRT